MLSLNVFSSLEAVRLRFILENNTKSNLFVCLRTHDCNPMIEAPMPPGTRENIYTENFNSKITNFTFKLLTNYEVTSYSVIYHPRAKTLQLQKNGLIFDEIAYDATRVSYPPLIKIDKKLDAYFAMDEIYNINKKTGMNLPNTNGYRPSLYLGNNGKIGMRRDQNRFCPKNAPERKNLASLTSYAGRCEHDLVHDNLNPFCKKRKMRRGRFGQNRNCTRCA
jgi:hypothetical protein